MGAAGTVSTMTWSGDMTAVYVAGGALALGLVGYGVYKAYQAITHAQEHEAAKQEGLVDAGAPSQDAGAPTH